jgi:hypothetical protein
LPVAHVGTQVLRMLGIMHVTPALQYYHALRS